MIFSAAWAGTEAVLPGLGVVVVYLARTEGGGSFFPRRASVRPTPRRLVVFPGFGRRAMIFGGETMSNFTTRTGEGNKPHRESGP